MHPSNSTQLSADEQDRVAFELGQDHARFNLRRPRASEAPNAFLQGYDAYEGKRRNSRTWAVNKWLTLRYSALKRNYVLTDDVTPQFLDQIAAQHCPVTLAPLTRGTGQETDCSIDRLISTAAYARGNLVAMSVKANQAKADLSFEEVRQIAITGGPHRGLSHQEWARILSLMFGAWAQINGNPKGAIFPLCTATPTHLYVQPTQVFQEIILQEVLDLAPRVEPFWRAKTYAAMGSTKLYDDVTAALRCALKHCSYPYDAWTSPDTLPRFIAWFDAMAPALALHLQDWNRTHRERNQSREKYALTWSVATQGKAHKQGQSRPA